MTRITDLFDETNPEKNGGQKVIIGKANPFPSIKGNPIMPSYGDKDIYFWSFKVFVGNSEPQKEYYLHISDSGECELIEKE